MIRRKNYSLAFFKEGTDEFPNNKEYLIDFKILTKLQFVPH